MNAPRVAAAVATALLTLVAAARAEPPADDLPAGGGYYAYAEVIDVTPHYGWRELSEPVLQCIEPPRHAPRWQSDLHHHRDAERYRRGRDHHRPGEGAAGLVGGLIGGLIGHQFGGGSGKTALTIAGAAIGASVARDYARERRHGDAYRNDWPDRHEPVRHCIERYQTRRVRNVSGYDVTYRYRGATFHKRVDEHPGDVIRVRVDVAPAADG